MNRTVFSLPAQSEYRTRGGLAVIRSVEQFSGGANRLDRLIDLLDRRRAGHILRGVSPVDEEQRTRRASLMSLVRDLVAAFGAADDPLLGLYGAFAYDLVFQIEDLVQKRPREKDQRDIVLYVPDRLLAYDRATGRGVVLSYDFAWKGKSTEALPRETADSLYLKTPRQGFADHAPGEYQATVETARAAFARGDLFDAVPGQLFAELSERSPEDV